MKKLLVIFFILFFFTPRSTFAETNNFDSPYACPNFEFTKNLQKGVTDEDVYVLQQILNLDKRTLVAQTGPGSVGKETAVFGNGTREALKRFQALFIEYIEIADGKFNTKTRTVMNNVCKGPFFTGQGGNIYDNATNTDKIAPVIGISGPKEINLSEEVKVKVFIGASEAIKTPNLIGLIIDGATASDVRKTSSTTFSFLVTPNEDTKDKITLQFEADSIEDLAGNKNEVATNEWEILVVKATGTQDLSGDLDTSILDDILNSVVSTIATSTDCANVGGVDVRDYQNPCYGKAPMTGGQGNTPEEKKDDGMMQMLGQVLQGLMQALKGGQNGGGSAGGDSMCACSGEPTTMLLGKSGPSGRTKMAKNPRTGTDYVSQGKILPSTGVCGQSKSPKCPGGCCNPQSDMTGMPVMFDLAPGPFWSSPLNGI